MVSIIKLADILLIVLVVNSATSIRVGDSQSNGPLVFTKWPPVKQHNKPPSLRHQLVYHLRTNGRIPPPGAMRKRYHSMPPPPPQQRVMRPMKMPMMPHYMTKGVVYPVYKPTMSSPPRMNFHSSMPGPNTGEYVYENPFASMPMPMPIQPNKNKVSITGENRYGPIHTIPAPNLAYSVGNEQIVEPLVDNQLNEKENYHVFNMLPPGNYHQQYQMALNVDDINQNNDNVHHQYQVTEPSSDHIIREPIPMSSAEQTIYTQSANDAIPMYKLSPSYDVFQQQSTNTKTNQIPLDVGFMNGQHQMQTPLEPSTLIQLSNTIPQQQLPDTYALPISNQPQLQQHLLQQQSMTHGAPLSAYNPTYLVTQSNNLLNQHRERLFKPAPAFLGTINQPSIDLSPNEVQPFADVNSVASSGQIQTSNQSQMRQVETASPPSATPNDFPSSSSSVAVSTNNFPKFERFTAQRTGASASNDIIFGQSNGVSQVQQPILTEQEVASYLNLSPSQYNGNSNNQGFIASSYYQAQPDPQVEIENSRRQQLNDLTISQANAEIRQRFQPTLSTIRPNSQKAASNVHEEHQQKLAQQFGNKGQQQLRIYVPDEHNNIGKRNELRRSDDNDDNNYSNAVNEDVSAEEEQPTNQYFNDDANDVTTDGSEEYFMHDTESVDRLAMDGETREPVNSSTLSIDRNYY